MMRHLQIKATCGGTVIVLLAMCLLCCSSGVDRDAVGLADFGRCTLLVDEPSAVAYVPSELGIAALLLARFQASVGRDGPALGG